MNKVLGHCVLALLFLAVVGCSDSGSDSANGLSGTSRDCGELEPTNPYAVGSGHYAGFEWAEARDVGSCDGNSTSFIEGCEEYLRQTEALGTCESEN